ncbi:TonB-dependent receptor [Tamlana sedimentorum]|uniref:TonB-dependent receptor n=1 Tax=Neotamlana sedimentorum TaxID=1435349 RepID=A0A0D7W1S6_9FLAO|nr:outer membrane beta-barrel protein [Tamlana sedimentorum]KJD32658.1 TonB-dependent receptor [Tamlana sedimentorum]
MHKLLFVVAFCCCFLSFSQSKHFQISGKIISEEEKIPLEAATVHLETVKDSSLVTYTISNNSGHFILKDETYQKSLNLFVSYVGYQTYKKEILINKSEIDLGTINLAVSSNALDEVLIKTSAPVTIKKDTLEFNVSSFKTKKDATVEDLLKQLPGVEIDDEGKIKVNGKEVNEILVNGKPFFGSDPSITTKNLTKDIIEKIQVVDTKTKSEAFTGEEGDSENKTINLTIKEENNKGVFGRVSAGGGTDKRYEFAGMFNHFDNDQRLSVLVGGNNINSPGFSFGEIEKMFGGGNSWFNSNGSFSINGRQFGGGEGLTTSRLGGANYADSFGKNTELSSDYFYSGSSSENDRKTEREVILADSRYYVNSNSSSLNETDSHSFNTDLEVKIDSTFMINIKPSFAFTKTKTEYTSNDKTLDENLNLTNQSNVGSFVENNLNSFSNAISATKKFGSKGAFLRFNFNNKISKTEGDDYINSLSEVIGSNPETIERKQLANNNNKSNDFSSKVRYRWPIIAKKLFVNFDYEYQYNKDENLKSTFDFDDETNGYTSFNEDQSTNFKYTDIKSAPGAELSYRADKLSTRMGVNYVFRTLKNFDELRPQFNVEREFKALELNTSFNYKFSEKASVYSSYRLTNRPPAIRFLQAFTDISNPLNIIMGNPNLKPTNENRFYINFNAYNWQERTGFYLYASVTSFNNAVVSKSTIDSETLTRTTTYENVNGNNNGYFGLDYSKSVKLDSIRSVRFKLGAWSNLRKNINFNNDVKYASNSLTLTPNLGIDFVIKDVFEFKPRYRIGITNTKYDLDDFEDVKFTSHNLLLRTGFFLPKGLEWRNDVTYTYNPNVSDEFQKSAWFFNSTVSYSILKDKGLISLKVYDLLNQNTNAVRTATQDYIEDAQSTVLRQYFMLSFSWKFNSLGSKGETGGNGPYFID